MATALGITAGAAFALFFGLPDGSQPSDYDVRKVRATALVTMPNGTQVYRTLGLPFVVPHDGGAGTLPDELVASCLASAKFGPLTTAQVDDCIRGAVQPPITVRWVGGEHDAPGPCDDDEVCDGGAGIKLEADQCAARGWPAAGACLLQDGGAAPFGVTLAPGSWSGAGCIPRVCVVFANGASGVDPAWPDEAPLQLPDGGLVPPRAESP